MLINRSILLKLICYFCIAFFMLSLNSLIVSPSYAVPTANSDLLLGNNGESGTIRAEKPIYTASHDIIRIIGTNMQKNGRYWVNIYDGKDSLVATIGVMADKETGGFIAAYQIKGLESPREWRAEAGKGHNPIHIEARCNFIVEAAAIPELSAGITGIAVAGICAFIYYRMRKGKDILAA